MTEATDSDLQSTQKQSPSCSGGVYDLALPFVGTWKEYTVLDEGEALVGQLTSKFEVNGCTFSQRFVSADGNFSFLSFAHVETTSGQCLETYVFNDGRVASYRWRAEGEEIITDRVGGNPADLRRLRIKFVNDDLYEVLEQKSLDGGDSWEDIELTRTRRVEK